MSNLHNSKEEEWLSISDLPDHEISNFGRIQSMRSGRILKQDLYRGYKKVRISLNGKKRNFAVHRLVAIAFIPNPENKPQVNHINSIPSDNNVWNLEWASQIENTRHRDKRKKKRKVTMDELNKMYEMSKSVPLSEVSKHFKIDRAAIHRLLYFMHPDY